MYASHTGTKTTLAMFRASKWGVLFTPDTVGGSAQDYARFHSYAMDNGAWGAFAGKRAWPEDTFVAMAERHGSSADFVVVPDVVGDRDATLEQTRKWMAWCMDRVRVVLVAVQDGMTEADLPLLGERVGVFVGGSTDWKWKTAERWAQACARAGAWCHVGRVNSAKRIASCVSIDATSCDGNSSVLFPCTHARLEEARRYSESQLRLV